MFLEEVTGNTDGPMPEVTGIRVKNIKTNETLGDTGRRSVHCHRLPNTELFKDQLKMDSDGYLITNPDSTSTEIPGVYAAGDVQTTCSVRP